MSVLAKEFTNSPEIPKSHSLISPFLLMRILDGFTSAEKNNKQHKGKRVSEQEQDTRLNEQCNQIPSPLCITFSSVF